MATVFGERKQQNQPVVGAFGDGASCDVKQPISKQENQEPIKKLHELDEKENDQPIRRKKTRGTRGGKKLREKRELRELRERNRKGQGSQNYRVEALDSQKSAKDQVIKAFKRVSGGATELRQTRQYSAQELIRLRKKVDQTKLPEIVQHLAPIRTGPNKTLIFPVNLAVESDRILDQILDRTIDSELQGREPYFIKKMTQLQKSPEAKKLSVVKNSDETESKEKGSPGRVKEKEPETGKKFPMRPAKSDRQGKFQPGLQPSRYPLRRFSNEALMAAHYPAYVPTYGAGTGIYHQPMVAYSLMYLPTGHFLPSPSLSPVTSPLPPLSNSPKST